MTQENIYKNTFEEKIALTISQIEMLKMSEDDYLNGRIISNEELEKQEELELLLKIENSN